MADFCLVMAQINPLVGDVAANARLVVTSALKARDELNADLIVFPELTLTGYPPEDLLLRPDLIKRVEAALTMIKETVSGIALLIGYPAGRTPEDLYNVASFILDGEVQANYYKQHLPNYSVFDEKRYFVPGRDATVIDYRGVRFAITICEDIWFSQPILEASELGAEVLLNLNASPFIQGKCLTREEAVSRRIEETGLAVVYVNMVGGQDELVFDGGSFVLDSQSNKVVSAPMWQSGLFPVYIKRLPKQQLMLSGSIVKKPDSLTMVYQALVMGLRDYIEKNHFPSVVLGLSGGIDSALVLAIAVDAIGADRVKTVMMPSQFTAQISLDDAQEMAEGLGVNHSTIAIQDLFLQFQKSLATDFENQEVGITEQNIQARCRGILLMAISNKTGAMVLSTGNKSEMAVGYSTLYGDMAGGYAPLKDVYKTLVYRLAEYRNSLGSVIPQRIITRPPSAELAEDQVDQDSLPPYTILDEILEQYIAEDKSFDEIVARGGDPEIVKHVISLVDRNEYKRRQAPPGIRITDRAFGRDRRYPITSGYSIEY